MSKTVDVDLINAFWSATRNAFQVMANLPVKRRRVLLRRDNLMHGDIYAVVGLADGMTGNVAVCFRRALATEAVSCLFGDRVEEDELLVDGIGELANLVAGGGRRHLADMGYRFEISPPTNLVNKDTEDCEVFNPPGTVCLIIECVLPDLESRQPFTVEISLEAQDRQEVLTRKQSRAMDRHCPA